MGTENRAKKQCDAGDDLTKVRCCEVGTVNPFLPVRKLRHREVTQQAVAEHDQNLGSLMVVLFCSAPHWRPDMETSCASEPRRWRWLGLPATLLTLPPPGCEQWLLLPWLLAGSQSEGGVPCPWS